MRRRAVMTLLAGAAAWPLATRAQQAVPVIGYLNSGASKPMAPLVSAFHEGLSQAGYVEGRNVAIEYRWSEGRSDRLPDMAAELVRRGVAIIVAVGGSAPARAAKEATATIPIVFVSGDDAIEAGLVTSLGQPGGNVTGISWLANSLEAKRIGLLRELIPAGDLGVLVSAGFPRAKSANARCAGGGAGAWHPNRGSQRRQRKRPRGDLRKASAAEHKLARRQSQSDVL